eukprot:590899-Rhodomonas_salina.2
MTALVQFLEVAENLHHLNLSKTSLRLTTGPTSTGIAPHSHVRTFTNALSKCGHMQSIDLSGNNGISSKTLPLMQHAIARMHDLRVLNTDHNAPGVSTCESGVC